MPYMVRSWGLIEEEEKKREFLNTVRKALKASSLSKIERDVIKAPLKAARALKDPQSLLRQQDELLYHKAFAAGLRVAGMVSCGVDSLREGGS